jgi:hypothetical protein
MYFDYCGARRITLLTNYLLQIAQPNKMCYKNCSEPRYDQQLLTNSKMHIRELVFFS